MRADVRLTVGPGPGSATRIEEMVGEVPIAWRPAAGAVYMVGTAAAPVGRDRVAVTLRVRSGARLVVRSSAASVIWAGTGSRQTVRVAVEERAELVWCPEPLIATAGCHHRQEAVVEVAPGGRLSWREVTVLGRAGEDPGRLESSLRVTVGGAPVLHHALGVGTGHPGWDGPAVVGPARVVAQLVVAGAGTRDVAPAAGPGWSVTPLPGPAALATVTAGSVGAAESALAEASDHLSR